MQFASVYKWKAHFGVYDVGTFILDFRLVKDGNGDQPDLYVTFSIGKFVVTIGKYHHLIIE